MKTKFIVILLAFEIFASGCVSAFGPELGMTEKQWLRRTLIADVAYMEGDVKAYKSNGIITEEEFEKEKAKVLN